MENKDTKVLERIEKNIEMLKNRTCTRRFSNVLKVSSLLEIAICFIVFGVLTVSNMKK